MVQSQAVHHSRCHANAKRHLQKEIIQGQDESERDERSLEKSRDGNHEMVPAILTRPRSRLQRIAPTPYHRARTFLTCKFEL